MFPRDMVEAMLVERVGTNMEAVVNGRRYRLVPVEEIPEVLTDRAPANDGDRPADPEGTAPGSPGGKSPGAKPISEVWGAGGDSDALTPRELEVARLVATGNVNKEIAAKLGISEWTVSTHLRRIFAKLHVETRAAMVAALLRPRP